MGWAEHVADEGAELGDGFGEVGGQVVTVAQEEEVLLGGGAEGGSCVGDVGGAAGGGAVWGVEADGAEGHGDGVEVRWRISNRIEGEGAWEVVGLCAEDADGAASGRG